MFRQFCSVFFRVVVLTLSVTGGYTAFGAEEEHLAADSISPVHESESAGKKSEKLNPSNFIFDHINDAHEWHIMTIGHTHVTIPLPVIVFSKTKGLNIFMSSRFKHGHATYKGFHLETEGENKNDIFEEDGSKPFDLSVTKNVASMIFGCVLLLWMFLSIGRAYRKNPVSAPVGLQSWLEPVVLFIRDDVIKPSVGPKYERYTPYLLTLFFFILINNLLGLIPIPPAGANLTGNIAVTMVLAVITFLITNIGAKANYWKHIFNDPNVPWWLKYPLPIMPLVEFMGIFTKPIVLMIRLFANITAGHIMVMAFIMLIYIFAEMSTGLAYGVSVFAILFNVFLSFIELLVAFIQAFIFTFLSSIYFGLALVEHHDEHQKEPV